MSILADVRCDRCTAQIEVSVRGGSVLLPPGWSLTDAATHCCPGCTTAEDRERHETLVETIKQAFQTALAQSEEP